MYIYIYIYIYEASLDSAPEGRAAASAQPLNELERGPCFV